MTTEAGALFLHVLIVIVSLSMAAVLHTGLILLHNAHAPAEVRPWPSSAGWSPCCGPALW